MDPSVEFGLRFETQEEEEDDQTAPQKPAKSAKPKDKTKDGDAAAKGDAQIVSLDTFRK